MTIKDTSHRPLSILDGLDGIEQYQLMRIWFVLCAYFVRWLSRDPRWNNNLLDPAEHGNLALLFNDLEAKITNLGATSLDKIRNGQVRWRNIFLRRLARSLRLYEQAEARVLRYCHTQGYFDQQGRKLRHRFYQRPQKTVASVRPKVANVVARVQAVLREVAGVEQRAKVLLNAGLCPDTTTAQYVAQALDRSNSTSLISIFVVRMALKIVRSYLTFGTPGLLVALPFPLTDEILWLEQQWAYIQQSTTSPKLAIAALRADFNVLYNVLSTIEPGSVWWRQDLLHETPNSSIRQQYIEQITPETQAQIIHLIAQRRGCNVEDAALIFDLYVHEGRSGLVDWRCGLSIGQSYTAFTMQRILQAFNSRTQGLRDDDRQTIETRLRLLQEAIAEIRMPLSLHRLVNERIGSYYRRRLGRRLRFGRAAGIRRWQRKRRGRSIVSVKRIRPRQISSYQYALLVEQMIAAFARRAGLTIPSATALLRELVTYGAIGLLEKTKWRDCIDGQVRSVLLLFRYGPLDRSLHWSAILQQVNDFAQSYNKPVLASQLARVIFNNAPKSRVWHGGVGDAVVRVRQRPTLGLSHREWLNRVWRYFVVPVTTLVTDPWGNMSERTDYIVLLADLGSECPPAAWYSDREPGSAETGLAFYQGVWHPGTLGWPLRGLPEVVQIPESLAVHGLEDFYRAAKFLMIKVQVVEDRTEVNVLRKRRSLAGLVRALPGSVQEIVRRPNYQNTREEHKRIQDGVLSWIYTYCFRTHRTIPVPEEFRRHGVALPGHDSPGAGWLLPVDDEVATDRRGIVYHNRLYTNPSIGLEPGYTLGRRAFPYYYERLDLGYFVQDGAILHYVTWNGTEA